MEKEDWKIPLYKIYTDDEDVNLITKIIKRGNQWALGPEIEEFENELKKYIGVDYCLALNSGTSALHAALLSHNIGNGDNVIIPSFTFIATANTVLGVNAEANFADIEDVTYGLNPNLIKSKINKKTKAIIPVDIGGTACDILKIKEIAQENDLIVIEDSAESLGTTMNDNKIGSISDISIFSFCGNKVLTTGEGGAITTNSKEIYEKIKLIRSHGRLDSMNYFNNPEESQYFGIGYNWRMSTMTAVLGLSQLSKLDKIIKMRQDNAKFISSKLEKFNEIATPKTLDNTNHIFQMYTIRLKNKEIRDKLHKYLLTKKIFSKVYFSPIHKTEFYKEKYPNIDNELPVTNLISSQVLTLPLYPNMTNEEKNLLVNSISEFFEQINS
jgi:perosamine synthetase